MNWQRLTRKGGDLTKLNLLLIEAENGGYDTDQGFFTVHWEVQANYPERVYLHVESPKKKDNKNLNHIKEKVIKDILNSDIPKIAKGNGLNYALGSRIDISYIQNNKNTGAFSIDFLQVDKPENLILKVHDVLGKRIEEIISLYKPEISKIVLGKQSF
jgi:hypothetical protein